jgi:ribose/xylose/arabinose/galactoside ABC-type transport system permease subunit
MRLRTRVVTFRGSQSVSLQLLIGIALLYGLFAVFYTSEWLARGNTENLARQGSVLLVVSLAQMFALLVGGFDISVGANMGFTSVVTALIMTEHGTSIVLAIAVGLAVATLIGFVNGFLISALGVSPFAATLGMLSFLIGFGNVLASGQSVAGVPDGFTSVGGSDWGPVPSGLAIAAMCTVFCWVVLRRLRLGLYMYGIGGSRNTSRLAGVPTVWYEIVAYSLCGFLAGVAGIMLASRLSVGQTELGSGYELLSIATAVIGGTAIGGGIGTISGVVLGAILIQVLTTGLDIAGVGTYQQAMITGVVIVAAGLIGLLRAKETRQLLRVAAESVRTARVLGRGGVRARP